MKILVREEPRTIALVSKSHALLFRHIRTKNKVRRCVIEFSPKEDINLRQYRKLSEKDINGVLGLIEIDNDYYICTITGSSQVAKPIPGESIRKIHSVEFFNINNSKYDFMDFDSTGMPILPDQDEDATFSTNGQYQRHPCHELTKLLSTGGFYFSTDFDLTSSLQSRGVGEHSLSFDNYKEDYMWNSFMLQEIVGFRDKLETPFKKILDDEGFLTTVIRGFSETFQTYLNNGEFTMTVISRQSWKRAGTRFNSRGIDDDGYVANFVETEYILYSSKFLYSYAQIRGSVPVFWEQDTSLLNPKVQITRSAEATQPVFDTHFKRILDSYGAVNIVNLLSTKSNEIPLSKRYRQHVQSLQDRGVSNLYLSEFDFHRETSNQGYSSSTKIYNLIKESLYEFGYFSYDVREGKILSEQSGVFRTNCLDCLDRTNLIQQFISNFALSIFLKDHDYYASQESEFINRHNSLWADNGDQISQIYTGTNALKSSFSRSGKMSFAGALSDATKSVSRMYINNFVDKGKQVTIDTLLGRLSSQSPVLLYDPVTEYVSEKINEIKDQYTSSANINIFTGTYNVNGIGHVKDLSEWLYPIGDKFRPNIVVLGFQEVIELNAGSILNADYSKSSFWTNEVSKSLNQFDKYVMLRAEQMSSLLLLFFVRADSVNDVKKVEGGTKKTGLGGMTGNKGAVAIRFDYGASTFCFVNVHLAAGTSNIQERNNDHFAILNGIRFTRGGKIDDNDTVFWIGDLNYRISLSNEEVRSRLENNDFEYLIKHDQLTNEMKRNNAFQGYSEPTINFRPTYKYDKGLNIYDSSEKARTPSWTDRIIYKGSRTKPLAYSSSDSLIYSDHKPVYAAYKSKVEFVDEEKKIKLGKDIYDQYKSAHPDDNGVSLLDFSNDSESSAPSVKKLKESVKEAPNFIDSQDDNDDFRPQLPARKDVTSPIITEILTPKRNSATSTPPIPPTRKSTISSSHTPSVAPPPPAPRVSSSHISTSSKTDSASVTSTPASSSTNSTPTSPPPPPAPRKQALPPGYSEAILQPKNSKPPTRVNTPVNGDSSPKKQPPLKPKKPDTLHSTPTDTSIVSSTSSSSSSAVDHLASSSTISVPLVPKKPASLKKVSTDQLPKKKQNGTDITTSTDNTRSPPVPPQSRKPEVIIDNKKNINSWTPLTPK